MVHDPKVVGDRDDAGKDGYHHQPGPAAGDGRPEEEELSDESNQRGKARQREHEDRHQDAERLVAVAEAGEVVELVVLALSVDQNREDGEGAEVHEDVSRQVEEHRRHAVATAGDDADQHVAALGDSGVGEQTLHARLDDRGQVADDHAQHGDEGQEHLPFGGDVGEAGAEDADDHGEGRRLGAHRHESGDR